MTNTLTPAARVSGTIKAEIDRLRPHYLSSTSTDQARRQMLDHFDAFADRLAAIQPDPEPQQVAATCANIARVATPSSAGTVSVEAAARVVAAYDRDHPMRTADQHRDGCDCLRCSVDALRALAEDGK